MMTLVLPFRELPEECLSIGPSQGLAYGLDRDIILKVPFQYEVTAEVDMAHCWDLSLGSLVAMEKELAVYEALRDRPHDNFTRRLASEDNLTRKLAPDQSEFLLLERLQPLQEAWPDSSLEDRLRWVSELVAAVGWLEKLGFVHGDLAVRNLGIDTTQRLKLFDFGSATPCSHPDYANDVGRDHFHLATCLHFILSGVDPFDHVSSHAEAVETRSLLESGQWKIAKGAEMLADVIQDGWTGRTGSSTFGQLSSLVAEVVGTRDQGSIPALSESHYQHLECRCRDWLRRAERDPLWKAPDEYVLACRGVGHEADLDLWR